MAREPGIGETLLSHALIRMFGRVFEGLRIVETGTRGNEADYPRNQLGKILDEASGQLVTKRKRKPGRSRDAWGEYEE